MCVCGCVWTCLVKSPDNSAMKIPPQMRYVILKFSNEASQSPQHASPESFHKLQEQARLNDLYHYSRKFFSNPSAYKEPLARYSPTLLHAFL